MQVTGTPCEDMDGIYTGTRYVPYYTATTCSKMIRYATTVRVCYSGRVSEEGKTAEMSELAEWHALSEREIGIRATIRESAYREGG